MMSTSLIIAPDRAGIANRALDLLVTQLNMAIAQRGEAHLALTGGSSAAALYGLLLADARARRVPWEQVHLWQGDERFVPTAHEDANWQQTRDAWLLADGGPAIPSDHLHPMVDGRIETGATADDVARRYTADIERVLPRRAGLPAFDIVLLGMGGDGHIMSVFPGSEALAASAAWAVSIPAPTHIEPHQPRVTLAPSLLASSGLILAMVPGAGKAEMVEHIFGPTRDVARWPAQLARRSNAIWLFDPDSASRIIGSERSSG